MQDNIAFGENRRQWRSHAIGGGRMNNWVILFVRTGSEENLTRTLKEHLNAEEYRPFLPVKETPRRYKGVVRKERKPLFPGYVFIQTEIEANTIAEKLKSTLTDMTGKWHKDIYSILHYGDDKNDVAVRKTERTHWERLFDTEFCITGSVGFIEGDRIRITSGPLTGMESQIKRINRHKREAVVEMTVMGAAREVRLMLEVVERVGVDVIA
jgi:transcriptional antiterminator NusG